MNITYIDELIDNIINDFNVYINKQTKLKITTFEINKYPISNETLKKIINDNDLIYEIMKIINKYIIVYTYLFIGYIQNIEEKEFIKQLLEVSNDTNINSIIINYYNIINNNLNKILTPEIEKQIEKYTDKEKIHIILQVIIYKYLYNENDKKKIYKLLMLDNKNNEVVYIDVIKKKYNTIDLNDIEMIEPKYKKYAYMMYKMLHMKYTSINNNEQILKLINLKILVPICDNFLLYNKITERYDVETNITKSKYIIDKVEEVASLYDENVQNNIKQKTKIENMFYKPLKNRKVILVNQLENSNILFDLTKKSINYANDITNTLLSYILNPYINFKNFKNDGISIMLNQRIDYIRYSSIEYKTNKLEIASASENDIINIVGFMIPSNNIGIKCIENKNIFDITTLKKDNKNGIELILEYLIDIQLGIKRHNSSVYWLFNTKTDNLESKIYEQIENFNKQEQIKYLLGILYNKLEIESENITIELINRLNQGTFKNINKIIDYLRNKIIINDKYNKKIEETINNKIKYKISENKINVNIPTLREDKIIIKEKIKKQKEKYEIININFSKEKEIEHETNKSIKAICQHNVTLQQILNKQKTNQREYQKEMMDFFQQYVFENVLGDFICISCNTQLNIKKYLQDVEYDNETKKFIPFAIKLDVPLEIITEYIKFTKIIKSCEKIIERIGKIINLQNLAQQSYISRTLRRSIIKNLIDILLVNKSKMEDTLKIRNENAIKKYNINKAYTKFYIFELDDNIFVYSSKDIDKYKKDKQRNIIGYLIYIILFEINNIQISYIGQDIKGLCNIQAFEKNYKQIFGNIKIIINQQKDVDYITNYKILCYMIYTISCSIVKFGLWNVDIDITKKKIEQLIYLQLTCIHTIIDIINSVLEQNDDIYIYKILQYKTFKKLNGLFKDDILYEKLLNDSIKAKKKKDVKVSIKKIKGIDEYEDIIYDKHNWIPIKKWELTIYPDYVRQYYKINNITNCKTSKFHKWVHKKGIQCNNCNIKINELKYNEEESKEIQKKYNKPVNKKLNLIKLENIKYEKYTYNKKNIKIEDFIILLKNNSSKQIQTENIYSVNHNHLGIITQEHIIKNIIKTEKHEYFKMDTLSYIINIKNTIIEIFYSYYNKILIGYKEGTKYTINIMYNRYITIKYSIENKLRIMGYTQEEYIFNEEQTLNIENILVNRINNIKNNLFLLQTIITRINNKTKINEEINIINKNYIELINKYIDKIDNIKINNKDNRVVLEEWKKINDNIFIKKIKQQKNVKINVDELNKIDTNGNILIEYLITELSYIIELNVKSNEIINLIIDYIDYTFDLYFYTELEKREHFISQFDIKNYKFVEIEEPIVSSEELEDIIEEENAVDTENDVDDWNDRD